MKLLPKDELAKRKSVDRSKEVEEGLKLSRKVDSLRELKAKEEESLEKFRAETLESIHFQIGEAQKEKEALLSEVIPLREEKLKGLSELKERADSLDTREQALNQREAILGERAKAITHSEITVAESLKKAEESEKIAHLHSEEANRLRIEAQKEKDKSDSILANANAVKEALIEEGILQDKELGKRESAVTEREKVCIEREKENARISKEISTEKLQLADQRATLERAMQRLGKITI